MDATFDAIEVKLREQARALGQLVSRGALTPSATFYNPFTQAVLASSQDTGLIERLIANETAFSIAIRQFLTNALRQLWLFVEGTDRTPAAAYAHLSPGEVAGFSFLSSLSVAGVLPAAIKSDEYGIASEPELLRALRFLQREWREWIVKNPAEPKPVIPGVVGELIALPADSEPLLWLKEHRARVVVITDLQAIMGRLATMPPTWLGPVSTSVAGDGSLDLGDGITAKIGTLVLHKNGFAFRTTMRVPLDRLRSSSDSEVRVRWTGVDEASDEEGALYLLAFAGGHSSRVRGWQVAVTDQVALPAVAPSVRSLSLRVMRGALGAETINNKGETRNVATPLQIGPAVTHLSLWRRG
ncbi:MAG: hypothetical protein WA751_01120 [Candidatus Dormiibacterota bacterium]